MAGVICSIVIDGKGVDKDDVKIVSDARRTVNRIMELIKSQKNLTAKMKRIGFFEDCNELEVAIENLFMDIERGESEVKIPNLTKIKVMAER